MMIWDSLVILGYFALVFFLGIYSSKRSLKKEDFFYAKHEISSGFLLLSLVATETSGLTFLSIPSLSYKGDFRFLGLALGYILGRILVSWLLLPLYFSSEKLSIYEYVGDSFGKWAQKWMSLVFTISRLLGDGIRLYISSLPIAYLLAKVGFSYSQEILGIIALCILSFVTILYSVYGGFRAIVFTDVLQWFVYIAGAIFSLGILILHLGITEWETIYQKLNALQKFQIFVWNYNWSMDNSYFFPFALLGGAFLSLGSHGTDLMLVQRVLASKNLRVAQRIMVGSGIVVFFQFFLFLGIGALLFSFYNGEPIQPDKVFARFITEEVPSPILGLLLAAILASSMSTLSSTINSLTLSWVSDWSIPNLSPKWGSFFVGLLLFFASLIPYFLLETWEKGLLEVGLTIFSYTLGPSLAVFFLLVWKRAETAKQAPIRFIASFLSGIGLPIALQAFAKFSFTVLVPMGVLGFLVVYFLSYQMKKFFTSWNRGIV